MSEDVQTTDDVQESPGPGGLEEPAAAAPPDASVPVEPSAAEGEPAVSARAPEPEPLVPSAELKAIVEALVFASPDPLTPKALYKMLDSEPRELVDAALAELKQDYDGEGGLQLVEVAGGFQIVTRSELHEWVRRLFHEQKTAKLSVQALETLAVIAYKQPITAAEIAEVRGVNTAGVLGTLIDRKLIKIVGRKQVVGRPFMYATTREFLNRFGLRDLDDLPKIEDIADALGFDPPMLDQGPSLPFDESSAAIAAALDEPPAAPDEPPSAVTRNRPVEHAVAPDESAGNES